MLRQSKKTADFLYSILYYFLFVSRYTSLPFWIIYFNLLYYSLYYFLSYYVSSFCKYSLWFQNAGAVIGKGGKNIKALRTDVSIFYAFHTPWTLFRIFIFFALFFSSMLFSLPKHCFNSNHLPLIAVYNLVLFFGNILFCVNKGCGWMMPVLRLVLSSWRILTTFWGCFYLFIPIWSSWLPQLNWPLAPKSCPFVSPYRSLIVTMLL